MKLIQSRNKNNKGGKCCFTTFLYNESIYPHQNKADSKLNLSDNTSQKVQYNNTNCLVISAYTLLTVCTYNPMEGCGKTLNTGVCRLRLSRLQSAHMPFMSEI